MTLESNQGDTRFGWSVAEPGDVIEEGYADVIGGTSNFDLGRPGNERSPDRRFDREPRCRRDRLVAGSGVVSAVLVEATGDHPECTRRAVGPLAGSRDAGGSPDGARAGVRRRTLRWTCDDCGESQPAGAPSVSLG